MNVPAATTSAGCPPAGKSAVVLWWLPVGAGGHVVRHTSWWWELLDAHRAHRPRQPLFHAALEVSVAGHRHVIEMAPNWGGPPGVDRGVVLTGPVGLRVLGRSQLFRYEVRCWRDGTIPDRAWAVGGPVLVTDDLPAREEQGMVAGRSQAAPASEHRADASEPGS